MEVRLFLVLSRGVQSQIELRDPVRCGIGQQGRQITGFLRCTENESRLGQAAEHVALTFYLLGQSLATVIITRGSRNDSEQGIGSKGLGQVVVGTGLEAFEHLAVSRHAGLHDDGKMHRFGPGFHPAQHINAVHVGHQAIQQNDMKACRLGIDQIPSRLTRVGLNDQITFIRQIFRHHLAANRLIINHQNTRFCQNNVLVCPDN